MYRDYFIDISQGQEIFLIWQIVKNRLGFSDTAAIAAARGGPTRSASPLMQSRILCIVAALGHPDTLHSVPGGPRIEQGNDDWRNRVSRQGKVEDRPDRE